MHSSCSVYKPKPLILDCSLVLAFHTQSISKFCHLCCHISTRTNHFSTLHHYCPYYYHSSENLFIFHGYFENSLLDWGTLFPPFSLSLVPDFPSHCLLSPPRSQNELLKYKFTCLSHPYHFPALLTCFNFFHSTYHHLIYTYLFVYSQFLCTK